MITTLSGSNDYMIDYELKKIRERFEGKYGDIGIEQIDGSEMDFQSIQEAVSNLSFLSPNKLIILKRSSANKQFIDSIQQVIDKLPQTNHLIIIEPNIDKRLSYYKLLKKITEFKSYDEYDSGQLINWIIDSVKQKGGEIKNPAANYLVEIAGTNQLKLSNEINKLLNYQTEITREAIDNLVEPIPQTTIFQLLEAAFSGSSKKLLNIYDDQRRQKVEPQQIIAMLTWQVHILVMIKAAGSTSSAQIASKTKVSPFVITKSMNIAKKMTKIQIQNLTHDLLELDIKLKNQTIDADAALLQLLLTIGSE